ncbi:MULTISPECIES: hypothetical protein [unclassified Stappia]|uniref:hypothetical protein n=1 Tax=unclassified Stappia TaxID=2629676 RepID=UPI001643DEE7|nr:MULTISPECIES: hypothetical protein [unclassified Stappia]
MSPRAQLRHLMAEVDTAADNAERALRRLQAQGVTAVAPERAPAVTPLRAGLILVSLLMAAKVIISND